ncbi:MAG: CHAT domain-containing protein [Prochlorothrix sp.]
MTPPTDRLGKTAIVPVAPRSFCRHNGPSSASPWLRHLRTVGLGLGLGVSLWSGNLGPAWGQYGSQGYGDESAPSPPPASPTLRSAPDASETSETSETPETSGAAETSETSETSGTANTSEPPIASPTDPSPSSPAQAGASSEMSAPSLTPELAAAIVSMENQWQQEYKNYLNLPDLEDFEDPEQVVITLNEADRLTGTRTGFLWIAATPDYISVILTTAQGVTVEHKLPVPRDRVMQVVRLFLLGLSDLHSPPGRYLRPAQQLYEWFVEPVAAELAAEDINTLIFCMGKGLRSLPIAALHDGEQFLVERYAPVRVPAFALSDFVYRPFQGARVLAMGASEFTDQTDLPAVPLEITTITQELWPGEGILNQDFTLDNLRQQRQNRPYEILHLATHANFEQGDLSNSYIQLWDERLTLDRVPDLNWSQPPVDLLVLSACETALGDPEAELGFAGLTVQAGVKSALASLWSVSDVGTLALMTEFYSHLRQAESKADALRAAQVSMLRGEVTVEGGVLQGSSRGRSPLNTGNQGDSADLTHPFYWSAFTLVGNPW